jgi:hypothetical protein
VRLDLIGHEHFLDALHLDQCWCVWIEHGLSCLENGNWKIETGNPKPENRRWRHKVASTKRRRTNRPKFDTPVLRTVVF